MLYNDVMLYLTVEDVVQLKKKNNDLGKKLAKYPKTKEKLVDLLYEFMNKGEFKLKDLTETQFKLKFRDDEHFAFNDGFGIDMSYNNDEQWACASITENGATINSDQFSGSCSKFNLVFFPKQNKIRIDCNCKDSEMSHAIHFDYVEFTSWGPDGDILARKTLETLTFVV